MSLLRRALAEYNRGGITSLKFGAKRVLTRKIFPYIERLGWHLTPVDYYYPIPNTRELEDDIWEDPSELVGIQIPDEDMLDRLRGFSESYGTEFDEIPKRKEETEQDWEFYLQNGSYESVDAEIYYSMIQEHKPNRIVEIGGGHSSRLAARAIREQNLNTELIIIEPYPSQELKDGIPGVSKVKTQPIQDIPFDFFRTLGKDDILFIDSSHVLKTGSDVQYEYLEILPRLPDGVLIHMHDIFLPNEYRKSAIMDNYLFWNEQYVLQAFLTFNNDFETLWAGAYMDHYHPDELSNHINSYKDSSDDHIPAGYWIRRNQ